MSSQKHTATQSILPHGTDSLPAYPGYAWQHINTTTKLKQGDTVAVCFFHHKDLHIIITRINTAEYTTVAQIKNLTRVTIDASYLLEKTPLTCTHFSKSAWRGTGVHANWGPFELYVLHKKQTS